MSKPKAEPKTKMGTRGLVSPERLQIVAEMMKRAFDPGSIQHELAQRWQVSTRTIRGYISRVRKEARARHSKVDPETHRAMLVDQVDDLYYIARDAGSPAPKPDISRCNQLLRTKAYILLPTRHELSGPKGKPIPIAAAVAHVDLSKLSDEELDALETINAKILAPAGAAAADPAGAASGGDPGREGPA